MDPPILDMLRIEDKAFVVTFVPSDDLSCEEKLMISIPINSVEGRQIRAWLQEFSKLFSAPTLLSQIVHSGGDDFNFVFADDSNRQLLEANLGSDFAQRVYDGLQYVSHAAENAYRIVQVNVSPTA